MLSLTAATKLRLTYTAVEVSKGTKLYSHRLQGRYTIGEPASLQNEKRAFILDTGSSVSVIPQRVWKVAESLGHIRWLFKPGTVVAKGLGGGEIPSGIAEFKMYFYERTPNELVIERKVLAKCALDEDFDKPRWARYLQDMQAWNAMSVSHRAGLKKPKWIDTLPCCLLGIGGNALDQAGLCISKLGAAPAWTAHLVTNHYMVTSDPRP